MTKKIAGKMIDTHFNTTAFVLKRFGEAKQAFVKQEIKLKNPAAGEVLIEAEAFGLNYADVMASKGLYKEAPATPCVIGYEVVGTVIQLGKGADPALLGKRVLAFTRFGGYSRHVVTFDYAVVEIENMPADEAMALCTQGATAYYMARFVSPLQPGDQVLIHAAAGGVGSILIQLAKASGATAYAKIGSENKRKTVLALGADHVINYNETNYAETLEKLLNGKKLDASFNPVGGSTFKKDLALLGSGGRLFLFGGSELGNGKLGILSQLNFVRKMGILIPIAFMMQSKSIIGVNMLKIADRRPELLLTCIKHVMELYQKDQLNVIKGGTYSSDKFYEAFEALASGKTTGKLTVAWEQ